IWHRRTIAVQHSARQHNSLAAHTVTHQHIPAAKHQPVMKKRSNRLRWRLGTNKLGHFFQLANFESHASRLKPQVFSNGVVLDPHSTISKRYPSANPGCVISKSCEEISR